MLTVYSKADRVVDGSKVEQYFEKFGTRQKRLLEVVSKDNPSRHVPAGAILSPSTTDRLAGEIVRFVQPLTE